jgi:hypothetical protein
MWGKYADHRLRQFVQARCKTMDGAAAAGGVADAAANLRALGLSQVLVADFSAAAQALAAADGNSAALGIRLGACLSEAALLNPQLRAAVKALVVSRMPAPPALLPPLPAAGVDKAAHDKARELAQKARDAASGVVRSFIHRVFAAALAERQRLCVAAAAAAGGRNASLPAPRSGWPADGAPGGQSEQVCLACAHDVGAAAGATVGAALATGGCACSFLWCLSCLLYWGATRAATGHAWSCLHCFKVRSRARAHCAPGRALALAARLYAPRAPLPLPLDSSPSTLPS